MTRTLAAVAVLAVGAGLAGCEGISIGPGDGPPPIPATVELLNGRTYAAPDSYILGKRLVESTEVKLAFDGTTITASAGCRKAQGRFEVHEGKLRAPNLSFAGKPCSKQLTKQESWLEKFLRRPNHAELPTERAAVLYLGNRRISMEMGSLDMEEPDQGRLMSAAWLLRRISIGNEGSRPRVIEAPGLARFNKTMPDANSIPGLSMYEGDQFDFYTGCGFITGSFSYDENSIQFEPKKESTKACGRHRKQFHEAFTPLFDGDFEYRFDGPDLILTQGKTTLRFFSG